ncbi:hypothetical protein E7T06_17810 [Deinococcus sp. Arct2-2]|uniref:hypothetical protein n=1 Tax=Deinococcus sp. Arct2-2 TaxID=2568653 RepID=UPI0010A59444|nr:hypothetical protein [Deinococcus sp. Arct2-2]THF68118.1 hypothetical protein E7T06_17810 [Deinococcus sp. Arct2-2]
MPAPLYRHGDVLLQAAQAPSLPLRQQPHLTLAYGEVTGHSHRIAEAGAAQLYAIGAQRTGDDVAADQYLHVTATHATLTHEEHGPIRLPTGWYRVWQQREYTPGSVRTVLD